MNVVAIVGSLREISTSRYALRCAALGATRAGAQVDWLDLRDYHLPLCDGRAEQASYGPDFQRMRALVLQADALLVGSPEYHGSMSGALKNALDLLGEEPIRGKLVGLCAVARGDAGAMNTLNHLRHVLRWMGAWVLPTQVSVPRAREAFDAMGDPIRPGLGTELELLGAETIRYAGLLASGAGADTKRR
ncbi:MAG: NAD(P)H-dependent oxidoreductase [Pseudomonadota bacterium]